jgi:drug/metabolite transporter (DMT)-like permease
MAFGAYLTLLGRIGADRAAYATVLFPLVALAISTVVEDYAWTPTALIGVALVLAGNLLVLLGGRRAAPPLAAE